MFYNGKNVLVKINDEAILATEAQLSYEAQIAPYFEIGQRYTNQITPENTIQGSLNFSYYLTGEDPIRKNLYSNDPIKFDFGGIIQTGYIKNYTARLAPHNPVNCNADIVFFRSPSGSFNPSYSNQPIEDNLVHINEVLISNFNNQYITGNYLSANFTYSADIRQEIYIGDKEERRGVFGVKEIVASIVCDNLNPLVEISGQMVGVSFIVSPIDKPYIQSYLASGFLTKKSFQTKSDDLLTTEISIRQYNLISDAVISGFSPSSAQINDIVTISGSNLEYTVSVLFGNTPAEEFTILNSQTVRARVPRMKRPFTQQIKILTA
jgi:hypothetical protein